MYLALKKLLPALTLILFIFSFQEYAQANKFGFDGRNGQNGISGRAGTNGQDAELLVTGQPVRLNLSGTDGDDSRSEGGRGENAYGCSYPMNPEYNIYGANGGDGGDGGSGGSGGRGGDLTLFYSNLSFLSKVMVISEGGRGGKGARPGYGGRGCICFQRSWSVRRCYNRPNNPPSCEYVQYYCQDGRDGFRGRDGASAYRGRLGRLTLIQGNSYPEPDVLSIRGTLLELNRKSYVLAENLWATKTGALALLAPGSVIDNSYVELLSRESSSTSIEWLAKRDLADFADIIAVLQLKAGVVNLSLPDSVWFSVEKIVEAKSTNFKITAALKTAEVRTVSFVIEGVGTSTTLNIKNGALYSDLLKNSLRLQVWQDKAFGDKLVFDEFIDSHLLLAQGADLTLNIGALKMKEKDTFKAKKKIKWQAILNRSMGEHSAIIDSGKQKYSLSNRNP